MSIRSDEILQMCNNKTLSDNTISAWPLATSGTHTRQNLFVSLQQEGIKLLYENNTNTSPPSEQTPRKRKVFPHLGFANFGVS